MKSLQKGGGEGGGVLDSVLWKSLLETCPDPVKSAILMDEREEEREKGKDRDRVS